MAQEIRVNFSLEHVPTNFRRTSGLKLYDQSANEFAGGQQVIGTVEEQVVLVDVTTAGYIWLENTDPTNFVQVGQATTSYFVKLRPGQVALVPLNGTALYCKADTAAVKLLYFALGA